MEKFRRDELNEFFIEEAERYATGEINHFSSYETLASMFGYNQNTISGLVSRDGLADFRRDAKGRKEKLPYPPSHPMAWMLGYLSSSGRFEINNRNSSRITVSGTDQYKRGKFNNYSELLFNTKPKIYFRERRGKEYAEVSIFSAETFRRLGNLNRQEAPRTLAANYPWLFKSDELTWSFIEGVFEAQGNVNGNKITFGISDPGYTDFLIEVLRSVWVYRPYKIYTTKERETIANVSVSFPASRAWLASHIHSANPNIESRLDAFR